MRSKGMFSRKVRELKKRRSEEWKRYTEERHCFEEWRREWPWELNQLQYVDDADLVADSGKTSSGYCPSVKKDKIEDMGQ